ncbi:MULTISPECIES: hypothetical protein [unclassified Methylobacterium]|uniref:hypothetical protein n=1 Tax=unclassified Methylobacterium TaxID=2615210 RepID=UPI0002DCD0B4|nr:MULTISPECIES: hypothetical protein [Methylobacterium]WFT77145.1 hypothetical protein QA634_17495 [Methylobacterium nodulans]
MRQLEVAMIYTLHWTAPSGATTERHDLGTRAAERAMTFVSMGASNVHVVTGDGRVFRAPSEMSDLVEYARAHDSGRG